MLNTCNVQFCHLSCIYSKFIIHWSHVYSPSILLGPTVHLNLLSNQPIMWQQCSAQSPADAGLCDFDCGMIVGVRQASLSASVSSSNLGCSTLAVTRVYSEWRIKTSSKRQFCSLKHLFDDRHQQRMTRHV